MDMKLEVLVVPVSDVDRAKRFYESLGFRLDIDYAASEDFRVAQFTPPGSEASIIIGKGITSAAPGSLQSVHLVVFDIEEARADLVGRGIDVSEVFHDAGGIFHHSGTEGRVAGRHPEPSDYGSFASFTDPDGNGWLLQEIKKRLPGRTTREPQKGEVTGILLEALKSAAAAHGVHEKELGRPDPDWPQWYAEHMARTLGDAGYQLTGPSA
jgi:catechol 2,3-dioxygenase-like lactoylglutathione lyase family enzyme